MPWDEEQHEGLILVVDDDEPSRRMLAKILDRNGYRCITAANASEARERMREERFALVLTDVDITAASGLDLLMWLSSQHQDVATVLISASDDPKLASSAIELGTYGFVIKPFQPNEILINVASALKRRRVELENRMHRTRLEQMVKDRTQELLGYISRLERAERDMKTLQRDTIQRLSLAAEFRDDATPGHVERVSRYCALIGKRIGESSERCEALATAGALHDVGKIGIPESILMKPGRLTDDEWEIMKLHCEIGYRLLSGTNSEVLNTAATLALTHHERVDGGGYPQGLKGEDIPIEGRIGAIADAFDAITTNRVYSRAVSTDSAIAMMRGGSSTHFDPVLLDAFLGDMTAVLGIKERFADPERPPEQLVVEDDPRRIP